jgi:aspartate carbamoyltransferase regulatory subunit
MNKKELIVSAIENGTVIDHIQADKLFQVIKILNLDICSNQILFGTNLSSKKINKKAIIKIQDKYFEKDEINKIAIVSPYATLITIKDYNVIEKYNIALPDKIEGIVKCFNPKCITNHEEVLQKFDVLDKDKIQLLCHYCQKITKQETLTFL